MRRSYKAEIARSNRVTSTIQSRSVAVNHPGLWSQGPWFESGRDYHFIEIAINTYGFQLTMKSICISTETAVGCKKTIYEVNDEVYDFVIKVLEGEEPVPSISMADVDPAPEM